MPQAPNLTLPDVNGSDISLTQFRGKPVVLAIAGKDSARQASEVTEAITVRLHDNVQLVCVMDLRSVPKLVRGMAKRAVARTYNDAVKGLSAARERAGVPVPDDPAQLVVMLRDTDGKAADAFGLGDVNDEVAAVLVDAQGNIVTVGRGSRAADDIVRALA
jgi:peroxiredoxin